MKTLPNLKLVLITIALLCLMSGCSGAESPTVADEEIPTTETFPVEETATTAPATETVVPSPEPTSTEAPAPTVTATVIPSPEPTASEVVEEGVVPVEMLLHAEKSLTQHSRPKIIKILDSLDDIIPPAENSWRTLQPGEAADFQSYDGIRIKEAGQATLDLGNQVHLIMKRDTTLQFVENKLAQEKLTNLNVDIDARLLEEIVLTLHLSRGGFFGSKEFDGKSIALSTPNAVVIVSGTDFFVAYDPQQGITWVCNLGGTIDVADVAEAESQRIPDGQLIAIPGVRGEKTWPVNEHLTLEGFFGLIDQVGSPTGALDVISGPYLIGQTEPSIEIRGGPGVGFAPVSALSQGEYARVVGHDGIWQQIVCPPSAAPWDGECWVPEEPFTVAYNDAPVDETSSAPPATAAAATPAAAAPTVIPAPVTIDPDSLCITVDTVVLGEIKICP